jgi:hypothetical protein
MASRMSPEDMRRAQEQMAGMKPEDMTKMAAQAQSQMGAQQSYVLRVSAAETTAGKSYSQCPTHANSVVATFPHPVTGQQDAQG